jgi:hypothetical protein
MDKESLQLLSRPESFIKASKQIEEHLKSLNKLTTSGAVKGIFNLSELKKANQEISAASRFLKMMSVEVGSASDKAKKLRSELKELKMSPDNNFGKAIKIASIENQLGQYKKLQQAVKDYKKEITTGVKGFKVVAGETLATGGVGESGGRSKNYGQSFWSEAKNLDVKGMLVAGAGVLGTSAGGPVGGAVAAGTVALVGTIFDKVLKPAVMGAAKYIEASTPMQMRGVNIQRLRQAGWQTLMGREDTLQMAQGYGQTGGVLSENRLRTLGAFSKGFGLSADQTGQTFGQLAGAAGLQGRGNTQMETVIARAMKGGIIQGIQGTDLDSVLDAVSSSVDELNKTLPTVGQELQTQTTAMIASLANQGMTIKEAGNVTKSIYNSISNPQGPLRAFEMMATGMTGGKAGLMSQLEKLEQKHTDKDSLDAIRKMKDMLGKNYQAGISEMNVFQGMIQRFKPEVLQGAITAARGAGLSDQYIANLLAPMVGGIEKAFDVIAVTNNLDRFTKVLEDAASGTRDITKANAAYGKTLGATVDKVKIMSESVQTTIGETGIRAGAALINVAYRATVEKNRQADYDNGENPLAGLHLTDKEKEYFEKRRKEPTGFHLFKTNDQVVIEDILQKKSKNTSISEEERELAKDELIKYQKEHSLFYIISKLVTKIEILVTKMDHGSSAYDSYQPVRG